MTDEAPPFPLAAVLPPTRGWPLFDAATTRALEAVELARHPPHALMARAGQAVARLALATQPTARSVLALAGPGNNGGDAIVAACRLHEQGWTARIVLFGKPDRLPSDAAWALAQAQALKLPVLTTLPDDAKSDLLLDGLLGVGATRAPAGELAQAVRWMNDAGRPVIAIDLPTGLDGDRGSLLGEHAVRATHTLALLTLKPGLFTADGRDHAGRVWLDTLGAPLPDDAACRLIAPPAAAGPAPHSAHKGRFGDIWVLGGAPGMVGAARLAARAALAAGAGRVYVALLSPGAATLDEGRPELMHRPVADLQQPAGLSRCTVLSGCGGGELVAATLPPLFAHAARLVLDADALNAVSADSALQRALIARSLRGQPSVLTPHPLEAARLLGQTATQVQADRPAAARALAQRFGAVVVLKGSGTLVATPDGQLQINPTGNALLASAGTGDVLAGWLAGGWARRPESSPQDVATAAVFLHGHAADLAAQSGASPPSLLASELIERMRQAGS